MKYGKKVLAMILTIIMTLQLFPLTSMAQQVNPTEDAYISWGIPDSPYQKPQKIGVESESEAEVVEEIISQRDAYTKHFRMSDGSVVAAIYQTPVHVRDHNEWIDIDNTLTEDSRTDTLVAEGDGTPVRTSFQIDASAEGDLVTVSDDQYAVSLDLLGSEDTAAVAQMVEKDAPEDAFVLDKLTSEVVYQEIAPSLDLEYLVTSTGIKENIVVKEKSDRYSYDFTLTAEGLTPYQSASNVLILRDAQGKDVYRISAPVMEDSNGAHSTDITLSLVGNVLTVEADTQWMQESERAFPVRIDPTIEYVVNDTGMEYGTLYEWPSGSLMAPGSGMQVGMWYNTRIRSFLKFSLPTLTTSDMVTSAVLNLGEDPWSMAADEIAVAVHKVTENWSRSGLTWNTQPDFEAQGADYVDCFDDGMWDIAKRFDITEMVRDWYVDSGNYGIALTALYEIKGDTRYIGFVEPGFSSGIAPMVEITYRNSNGVEDYWTYHSSSNGKAGQSNVNDFNGNHVYTHADAATAGNILPVSISHVFNQSERNVESPFGKGWKLNVIQKISPCTLPGYPYTLTDSDGTVHYFTVTDGTIHLEDDSETVLTVNSPGYTLTDSAKHRSTFNGDGMLVKYAYDYTYTDSSGTEQTKEVSQTFTYTNGKLTKATDGSEREITLAYGTNGTLSSITDAAGRTTSYSYNDGRLTAITYSNGELTGFFYDGNGSISKVTQPDGKYTVYDYHSKQPYRMRRITEYTPQGTAGNYLNFSYLSGETVVSDREGNSETMLFDLAGRTVSVRDQAGRGVFGGYNSGGNKNNTLSYSSDMQSTVINLLLNPNAERATDWGSYYANGGSGTVDFSNADKYFGSKSLRVVASVGTSLSGIKAHKQTVSVTPGDSYTFSAYVKMAYNNYTDENSGGYLAISYVDGNGATQLVQSMPIRQATSWERYSVTAAIPEDAQSTITVYAGMDNASGTIYFDGLQLERSPSLSKLNLLENAGFETGTSYWTAGSLNLPSDTVQSAIGSSGKGYILTGTLKGTKSFSQEVLVSGQVGDTFVFSGWGKAKAMPKKLTESSLDRRFALSAQFHYTDGTSQTVYTDFASYSTNWQYTVNEISALKPFNKITVSALYQNNPYDAVFDNIQLTRSILGSSYSYNDTGRVTWSTDAQGNQVQYFYDEDGNLIETKIYDSNYVLVSSETAEYDENDNVTEVTDQDNVISSYQYDDFGNIIKTTTTKDGLITVTEDSYTSNGEFLLTSTDESGQTASYNYDQTTGLLLSKNDPKGETVSYIYDQHTDELLTTTGNAKVNGAVVTVGNSYSYTHGTLDKIFHNGFQYTMECDGFGNQTAVKAGNRTLVSNAYGANNGKQLSTTYGNGDVVQPEYDSLDRVSSLSYNGTKTYAFQYSSDNKLGSTMDYENDMSWNYAYDNNGNLVRTNGSDGTVIRNVYDNRNQLTGKQLRLGAVGVKTISYTYTDKGLAESMTFATPHLYSWKYDALDRVTEKNLKISSSMDRGTNTSYTYESGGTPGSTSSRVSSMVTETYNGSARTKINDLRYTYDAVGNIETISEGTVLKVKYAYDPAGQLTREDNGYLGKSVGYTYDAGGNLLTKTTYPLTFNGVLANPQGQNSYSYGDSSWKDLLTAYNGQAITYDEIGNPLSYRGYTFDWQKGRELASLSGNGVSSSFKYNASGLRTEKTVNGAKTKYIWDGDKLVCQQNSAGYIWFSYDQNGELETLNYNGSYAFVIRNLQGDIIALQDQSGTVFAKYSYDSWGNVLSVTDKNGNTITSPTHVANQNPIRYRGYYYDTETGFYYLQSRYYDPVVGRFLNLDELFHSGHELFGHNMFGYCNNDAANGYDPSGMYNAGKAVAYAMKYYNKHNSAFSNFNSNNCANFVSQCLNAGGINMRVNFPGNGWHNIYLSLLKKWVITASWSKVKDNYDYFNKSSFSIKYTASSSASLNKLAQDGYIHVGDPVYMHNGSGTLYHVVIISLIVYQHGKVNGKVLDVGYAANTSNRQYGSFKSLYFDKQLNNTKLFILHMRYSAS